MPYNDQIVQEPKGSFENPKEGDNLVDDLISGAGDAPNRQDYLDQLYKEGWINKNEYQRLFDHYFPSSPGS